MARSSGRSDADADELEVLLGFEEARDALAQQRVVLREHDADRRHDAASLPKRATGTRGVATCAVP